MSLPTAQQLIAFILWSAPALQAVGTLAFLRACYAFRRNLGAHDMHVGMLVGFGAVTLALHAGYFLAPFWWRSGRCLLGAATMLPVALVVLGAAAVALSQTELARDIARSGGIVRMGAVAGAALLLFAYLGPLVVMLAGTR